MPFPPQVLIELAAAGANIAVDANSTVPEQLVAVVRYWDRGSGTVTIRNASRLPPPDLVRIARALQGRVTLEV